MAHHREVATGNTRQTGIRPSESLLLKSSHAVQSHPYPFVAVLLVAGAVSILHERPANAQQNSGGAQLRLAKQSPQAPKVFSSLSAAVSMP